MPPRFAAFAGMVHKRKETEVQGEFLLCNAPLGAQPAPQERPESFPGLHMDFTQAGTIFIASALAPSMVDTLMLVAPDMQARITALLVCRNKCPWNDGVFDQGRDRLLLHLGPPVADSLTPSLPHAKAGWALFVQCATAPGAFTAVSTSFASLRLSDCRLPCMACNDRRFGALHLV
jgi:hypothetical protein